MSNLTPYIHFTNTAREALEFYKEAIGGELILNTFRESGMEVEENELDLLMHGQLSAGNGMILMASDTPAHMGTIPEPNNISISLSGESEDDAMLSACFEKLAEGGNITQPLVTAPWGAKFGMLTDKFGKDWMVNIQAAAATEA